MVSLKSSVGKRSDLYHEKVTASRIHAFCKAICAEESAIAPPTFLTVFRKGEFELFQQFGIDLSSILHAEQEYQYENSIHAGDTVQFETTLSQVLEKQGSTSSMQFLTFETIVHSGESAGQELGKKKIGKSKTTIVIRRGEPRA